MALKANPVPLAAATGVKKNAAPAIVTGHFTLYTQNFVGSSFTDGSINTPLQSKIGERQ